MDYKVSTGLGRAYYALKTGEGEYGTVKELAELVDISVGFGENSTSLYAGNREVLVDVALGSIDVSFTVPSISDVAMAEIFGFEKAQGGGLIRTTKKARPMVAVMFEQTCEDGSIDYITLFQGKLNLPEVKGKTKESNVEFQTKSFAGKFTPMADGTYLHSVNSGDADFDKTGHAASWGKTVVIPTVKTGVIPTVKTGA